MPIEKLEIEGYRGFSTNEVLTFAIPNGELGSGLTIITGANNAGKSTIIEALRARAGSSPPSFSMETRNKVTDRVRIAYTINGNTEVIRSTRRGGSETNIESKANDVNIFVLPSRRSFSPFFGKREFGRKQYIRNSSLPERRNPSLTHFECRLFKIDKAPEAFNELLGKILPFKPDWTIDLSGQGQYFLKFYSGDASHNSDGMGDGITNIFCIADSLYDSNPGESIVVDEPELSLHPSLQKRLMAQLMEYSKDRQIIISTHSPYFVDIQAIVNGAQLVRAANKGTGIRLFSLSIDSVKSVKSLACDNLYNPHTFGLNGRELFFLEDRVILVEGQEDVLLYPEVARQVDLKFAGEFFGWGVGGAQNMPKICRVLAELGFEKVAGLLDRNQECDLDGLRKEFPHFFFACIPADDVRTKDTSASRPPADGLLDDYRKLKKQYRAPVKKLIAEVNKYLERKPTRKIRSKQINPPSTV